LVYARFLFCVAIWLSWDSKLYYLGAKYYIMYSDAHRNQFHFSPAANWMNDPNGMVYFEGEYHLFYQYYPEGIVWGPMHWGHAVSKDLVHWEHLPIALAPDDLGYIFSGSAVVDWDNTSGLGVDGKPPLVAIFTHHDMEGEKAGKDDYQVQSIAYSHDKGRTWTKYDGNPVLQNTAGIKDFRDPKVIWDDVHEEWIMVLAVKDRIHFYASKNLIDWRFLSEWGNAYGDREGVWECPDLFRLEVTDADTEEYKWVLLLSLNPGGPQGGSGTQYFVGDFDGKTFTLDEDFAKNVADGNGMWLDYGADNYAGVTWSDIPDSDNRRLFIGWMSNWEYGQKVPTEKWRSAMTVPRVVTLRDTEFGYRLLMNPVQALEKLETERKGLDAQFFTDKLLISDEMNAGVFALKLSLGKREEHTFGIKISNAQGEYIVVGFDGITNNLFVDRSKSGKVDFNDQFAQMHFAPLEYRSKDITFDILVDRASIEIFVDHGRCVMTEIYFSEAPLTQVELIAGDQELKLANGYVSALRSIWI